MLRTRRLTRLGTATAALLAAISALVTVHITGTQTLTEHRASNPAAIGAVAFDEPNAEGTGPEGAAGQWGGGDAPLASPGGCAATYVTVNSWPGGFQVQVTITAVANRAISGWIVSWTLGNGQNIIQLWNGTLTIGGSVVTVQNASSNGALAASGSTTFGFQGSGTPTNPTLTCTA